MPVQVLSAVSQVSFIEYSSPMPLVQKVLVCISWFYLSRTYGRFILYRDPVCLSRLIASRLALQEKKEARFSLVTGTLMAVFFSAAAGFLLFQHAYFFASTILKTPQTASLLRITAVSIPLCAIHSCIDSYYYARKKASVPAAVQLSEQAARIGTTYILYLIFLSEASDHCIDRSGWFSCRRGCRFAGVSAGSFLSFRKSPCTRKKSHQDLFAVKGPFHTVFSHFPEQDSSDTSRQHRSGSDSTDASAFRHDSIRLTENLWDLYRNGTAPAPVSFHTYVFRRCDDDAFHRTA